MILCFNPNSLIVRNTLVATFEMKFCLSKWERSTLIKSTMIMLPTCWLSLHYFCSTYGSILEHKRKKDRRIWVSIKDLVPSNIIHRSLKTLQNLKMYSYKKYKKNVYFDKLHCILHSLFWNRHPSLESVTSAL